jgi:hypothetical protein
VSSYTRVGVALFDWPPFITMSLQARMLWLGMYASPEAKACVPGLFKGSIGTMAEAARIGASDAVSAVDELQEAGLVVVDKLSRLTRFTRLPDRGERPANGKVLKMFWDRWDQLPEAQVKYDWIELLQWLRIGLKPGEHNAVWDQTFGAVTVPEPQHVVPSKQQTLGFVPEALTLSDTVDLTVSDTVRGRGRGRLTGKGKGKVNGEPVNGKPTHSPIAAELALYLGDSIRGHRPDFDRDVMPHVRHDWGMVIDEMLNDRHAPRSPDRVRAVIDFAHRDDPRGFWRQHVVSAMALNQHFNKLEDALDSPPTPAGGPNTDVRVGHAPPSDRKSYPPNGIVKDF